MQDIDEITLRHILAYIDENISGEISSKKLAEIAGLSINQFRRRFLAAMGVTVIKYVFCCRLRLAREMIETTDRSLVDIAMACGFCSQAHMTQRFLDGFGVSPGRLKRSIAAGHFPQP